MIGVTVNVYLGCICLAIACGLLIYGLVKWETIAHWPEWLRTSSGWLVFLVFAGLVAWQVSRQREKDHSPAVGNPNVSPLRQKFPPAIADEEKSLTPITIPVKRPPSSVPIVKAFDKANAPTSQPSVPTPRQSTYGGQTCIGSACAQGPGAQATYNQLGAPLPKVTATPQMQRQTGDPNRPWQTVFSVTSNVPVQTGDLRLKCTGPVLLAGISRINPMSFVSGSNGPDPNEPNRFVYELSPEPFPAGKPVMIAVYSTIPVTVVSGTIGSNPIVFRGSK